MHEMRTGSSNGKRVSLGKKLVRHVLCHNYSDSWVSQCLPYSRNTSWTIMIKTKGSILIEDAMNSRPTSINYTLNCLPWNSTSVAESLAAMMQKESTVYKRCDYLIEPPVGSKKNLLDEGDRQKIVDWCYSVVDICQLERETVAMAMEMVDRFLSNKSSKVAMDALENRIQYQLLALTALYISIKISMPQALGSDFMSIISGELYSVREIEAMELVLLKELSWCISAPTCVQMAHQILSLSSTLASPVDKEMWVSILDEVEYQAEHAVRHYCFVPQRPSTVAMAAIFNTLIGFDKDGSHDILRAVMSVMKNADFEPLEVILTTRNKLHSLVYGQDSVADVCDTESTVCNQ